MKKLSQRGFEGRATAQTLGVPTRAERQIASAFLLYHP